MATEPKSRRRRRKKIIRREDGSLFDASERRRITPAELRDYVRAGGLFEARRQGSGTDCTYEVLQRAVGVGMLQNLVPGGGGPLAGLAGLGGLAGGGGPLAALAGPGGLGELARALGGEADRSRDGVWDDREERPRRSPHRSPEGESWADGDWDDEPRRSERRNRDDWADEPDFD